MPTYDYLCTSCGYTFEVFQAMSDNALDSCPKCEGKVRRLVSGGTGLIFKGSGFYLTDYKNKPTSGEPKPESKEPTKKSTSENSKD
ncbi:MAG: zinc ribbon domain-containing protein [Candidatus Marinimicrobia bacterium]|nr:zinc ribbon domain-containing protein [Candidatus Neomarinimicrobiota bacterium]